MQLTHSDVGKCFSGIHWALRLRSVMRGMWWAIIVLAGLWSCVVRAGQQRLFLDLTTREAQQEEQSRTAACGGVRGGISTSRGPLPQPELPVGLHLEWIDRKDYKIG